MSASSVASTSGRACRATPVIRRSAVWHSAAPTGRHMCKQQQQKKQRCRVVAAVAAEDKPEWLRQLEADAPDDEDVARLLAGAGGDPRVIQQRMQQEMDGIRAQIQETRYGGEDAPMDVSFRSPADNFNLWVWMELYKPPSGGEMELLQEVINSWYMLGRLGAFNSSNLQVLYHQDNDLVDLEYDVGEEASIPATFHEVQPLESRDYWTRFWVDMGTADELALDMLINALTTFSKEQLGIKQLVIGGENDDWAAPARDEFLPEVTMDPMRGPRRLDKQEGDSDDEYEGSVFDEGTFEDE